MANTPHLTDDDKGEITAAVDGKVVRSWTYFSDGKYRQRDTMAQAREYAEGWHDASLYLQSQQGQNHGPQPPA